LRPSRTEENSFCANFNAGNRMLQAFFDESYDDDIFVMAGWLAPAKAWAAFSDERQQF